MIISREEAEIFLRELADDGSILGFVTKVGGVSISTSGFLALNDATLTLQLRTGSREKKEDDYGFRDVITIDLDTVTMFDYSDIRESNEDIRTYLGGRLVSALRMESPAIKCVIFECAPSFSLTEQ